MRITCYLAVLLASGAVAWAAVELWRASAQLEYLIQVQPAADEATPSQSAPYTEAGGWPSLFGVAVTAPTPVEAVATTPLLYSLKGLASIGATRWAVLSLEGVDLLVREGDVLGQGARVVRVHSAGVDILRDGRTTTLTFEPEGPGERTRPEPAPEVAAAGAVVSGQRQEAGRRGITDAEIGHILAEAEAGSLVLSR